MSGKDEGWFRSQLGSLDQRVILIPRPRHFGGRQWYFMCPVRNRPVSVLWKPNGATRFCSRQTWGRQVAYQSQFNDATSRAHAGKARIKSKLIADLDPDEWDFPPKAEMDAMGDVQSLFGPTRPLRRRSGSRFDRAGGEILRKLISFEIYGVSRVSQEISIQSQRHFETNTRASASEFVLMRKERQPAFRTIEGWARLVLREAGAIREYEQHGWAKDGAEPRGRSRDGHCLVPD